MNYLQMMRAVTSILAACTLLASIVIALVTADFLRDAKTASGELVAIETQTNENGTLLYRPTFELNVDMRRYSVTATSFISPSPGNVGEQVQVLYDSDNPSHAIIDSFASKWTWALVTLALAILAGAQHLGITWVVNRYRHIRQTSEHDRCLA